MGFLDRQISAGFRSVPRDFSPGVANTVPAPYLGINVRDDVTALRANEARFLENWFPGDGQLELRPGFEAYGSGTGSGEVKTLAAFEGKAAEKLVSAGGGSIYNSSASGAAVSLGSGFSEDRWQHDNFNDRLFLVNGTDAPQDFDGTTLSATAWTGASLTIANLNNVANVRDRLWFTENNSADVWYSGIGSITGGLAKFQLSQIASGGFCQAIGSWSRDAGDGADDFTVFVMSTGQIIIYQGDPAATFSLVGKYGGADSARPIGKQCLFKVGGELVVITRLGLLPVSAAAGGVALDLSTIDPWGKIAPLIKEQANATGTVEGWHGLIHDGVVYVNAGQVAGSLSRQIIMNTHNSAWTTYTGWNASAIRAFNDELYFGAQTGGFVRKVGGGSDNLANIVATARGAFAPLQNAGLFTAIRPKIQAQGDVTGFIGVDTDYFEQSLSGNIVNLVEEQDTTPWGDGIKGNSIGGDWGDPWGSKPEPLAQWFSIEGDGRSVAVKLQVFATSTSVKWLSTDILMKPGSFR